MTNVVKNYSFLDDVKFGYKDVTASGGMTQDLFLYNQPTLNVSGSSANGYAASISFANGIQVINSIGGVRVATIQSATLAVPSPYPAAYIFANTGGNFPVSIKLDYGSRIQRVRA